MLIHLVSTTSRSHPNPWEICPYRLIHPLISFSHSKCYWRLHPLLPCVQEPSSHFFKIKNYRLIIGSVKHLSNVMWKQTFFSQYLPTFLQITKATRVKHMQHRNRDTQKCSHYTFKSWSILKASCLRLWACPRRGERKAHVDEHALSRIVLQEVSSLVLCKEDLLQDFLQISFCRSPHT